MISSGARSPPELGNAGDRTSGSSWEVLEAVNPFLRPAALPELVVVWRELGVEIACVESTTVELFAPAITPSHPAPASVVSSKSSQNVGCGNWLAQNPSVGAVSAASGATAESAASGT